MPSNRIRIRPGTIYEPPAEPGGWEITSPPYNTRESISIDVAPLTLASIEHMLGMSSTVNLIGMIKKYIMDNLASIDETNKSEIESKVDRIIEALGRNNYMPTRRVYRKPPTHIVNLDDESLEAFINKISKCSYIKWRLASPVYWGIDHIGLEGVFKR